MSEPKANKDVKSTNVVKTPSNDFSLNQALKIVREFAQRFAYASVKLVPVGKTRYQVYLEPTGEKASSSAEAEQPADIPPDKRTRVRGKSKRKNKTSVDVGTTNEGLPLSDINDLKTSDESSDDDQTAQGPETSDSSQVPLLSAVTPLEFIKLTTPLKIGLRGGLAEFHGNRNERVKVGLPVDSEFHSCSHGLKLKLDLFAALQVPQFLFFKANKVEFKRNIPRAYLEGDVLQYPRLGPVDAFIRGNSKLLGDYMRQGIVKFA